MILSVQLNNSVLDYYKNQQSVLEHICKNWLLVSNLNHNELKKTRFKTHVYEDKRGFIGVEKGDKNKPDFLNATVYT